MLAIAYLARSDTLNLMQVAASPSGKAEVCKTSTPGSNPGAAFNTIQALCRAKK